LGFAKMNSGASRSRDRGNITEKWVRKRVRIASDSFELDAVAGCV
jgi:hypothetical protein